jgi:uncharacterized protein YggT (Ycf19 family)
MEKPSDSKLMFIKFAKVLTYLVYAYAIIAIVFLVLGFVLLLFGANQATPFVKFVYNIAAEFLQPFRDIFPGKPISDRGYFSAAGLFAIIIYSITAMAIHSLITFISLKQVKHQKELDELNGQNEDDDSKPRVSSAPRQPQRTSANKTRIVS